MKCITCGYETQPGAKFCVQCGTTVVAASPTAGMAPLAVPSVSPRPAAAAPAASPSATAATMTRAAYTPPPFAAPGAAPWRGTSRTGRTRCGRAAAGTDCRRAGVDRGAGDRQLRRVQDAVFGATEGIADHDRRPQGDTESGSTGTHRCAEGRCAFTGEQHDVAAGADAGRDSAGDDGHSGRAADAGHDQGAGGRPGRSENRYRATQGGPSHRQIRRANDERAGATAGAGSDAAGGSARGACATGGPLGTHAPGPRGVLARESVRSTCLQSPRRATVLQGLLGTGPAMSGGRLRGPRQRQLDGTHLLERQLAAVRQRRERSTCSRSATRGSTIHSTT